MAQPWVCGQALLWTPDWNADVKITAPAPFLFPEASSQGDLALGAEPALWRQESKCQETQGQGQEACWLAGPFPVPSWIPSAMRGSLLAGRVVLCRLP